MKKIFLFSAILFTLQSSGQQPNYDFKKYKENKNGGLYLPLDLSKQNQMISKDSLEKFLKKLELIQYLPGFGDLSLVQSDGNQVYILPQDNMPCIVPDLSRTNYRMPVLMNGTKITGMPPGSQTPVPIIPKEK